VPVAARGALDDHRALPGRADRADGPGVRLGPPGQAVEQEVAQAVLVVGCRVVGGGQLGPERVVGPRGADRDAHQPDAGERRLAGRLLVRAQVDDPAHAVAAHRRVPV
jgi:hypothetical protein